jgi:hypothetical protein
MMSMREISFFWCERENVISRNSYRHQRLVPVSPRWEEESCGKCIFQRKRWNFTLFSSDSSEEVVGKRFNLIAS